MDDGSERQNETTTLNAKVNIQLWTQWKMNDGFERWNETTALNAKVKMWLWTPNWKKVVALNAKQEINNGSERQTESGQWLWTPNEKQTMALNAKLKIQLWTLRWQCDSEHQIEGAALNA